MIELTPIRSFVVLSQVLHYGKAAQLLGISQPSLSLQIQKLEEALKASLFERTPQFVRLTQTGKLFLPKALKIIEAYSDALKTTFNETKTNSGLIRLGFIPTVGPYLLPRLITQLKKTAPQMKLELFELTTTLLLEQLKLGVFDLAVLALPVASEGLVSQSLGEEEFLLAVNDTHALAKKSSVKIESLAHEDVLMLKEGHCFRNQALEFCTQHNTTLKVVFEGSSLVSVMNLVSAQLGVTLVPKMATHSKQKNLRFIPFQTPKPKRELGVVWRLSYGLKQNEKHLIKILKSVI